MELMPDEPYDMFAPLVAEVPAYAAYLKDVESGKGRSVDGKTELEATKEVRKELYHPIDADNIKSTDLTKEHIVAFA